MNFYAIDTETTGLYYWKDKIFGISQCSSKDSSMFYDWTNDKIKEIKELFKKEYNFVGHNMKFDLHMLRQYGIEPPKNFHDTAIMAKLLDSNKSAHLQDAAVRHLEVEKWKDVVKEYTKKHKCTYDQVPKEIMNEYASLDAKRTWELAELLYPKIVEQGMLDIYNQEIKLTRCLMDIEARGVLINTELLTEVRADLMAEEDLYSAKIHEEVGHSFDILSEKQLGEVLFTELKLPIQGYSRKSGLPKVDDAALEKIDHPITGYIQKYRFAQKMRSTYCDNINEHLDSKNALHCSYHQYGTVTGRMSCREPNLQNIPKKSRVRELFIPRPGYRFVFLDYSQQEMRLYAGYANDQAMMEVFNKGGDIYAYVANVYYKTNDIKKGDPRRDFCKSLTLAILYGIGVSGISKKFRVSQEEAARIKNTFNYAFPKMKRFMRYISDKIKANGYIKNPYGRMCKVKADDAYKGINYLIQGSGGDIMKDDIIRVHEYLKDKKSGVIFSIHDDLGIEVHESELYIIPEIEKLMLDLPKIPVRLPLEVSQSTTNWRDKK